MGVAIIVQCERIKVEKRKEERTELERTCDTPGGERKRKKRKRIKRFRTT